MARFAAFLRAVNVGGTGKLPMTELKQLAEGCGFTQVQTYIASGNLVFETGLDPARVQAALEQAVAGHLGKPVAIFLRTAPQLQQIIAANPFVDAEGNRLMVILHDAPKAEMISNAKHVRDEEMAIGDGCLYAHYPSGMGQSKLKMPGAESGTARNMNTIRKILELLGG